MTGNLPLDSLLYGLISAVALPLGAALAMVWTPKKKMTAALMAFGAGALLSALTIDLVAEGLKKGSLWPMAAGCIIGGVIYVGLNMVINSQGGFLRKRSTAKNYLRRRKMRELRHIFNKLGHVRFFRHIPHDQAHELLPYIVKQEYKKGETILKQGETGDELFIVEKGEVAVVDENAGGKTVSVLHENGIFGELAFLKSETHAHSAVATKDCRIWLMHKMNLNLILQKSPAITDAMNKYLHTHIDSHDMDDQTPAVHAANWTSDTLEHADDPTHGEIAEHHEKHSNAGIAIWLGMLLDGIPEAIVLGASLVANATVSMSLMAGLVLSNFPESLSSSVEMRINKYKKVKIFALWISLFLICGVFAWLGNVLFSTASGAARGMIEGLAAGAMLTMIAETMLPEAYEKGGSVTGLSTLAGFLTAILFKVVG